MLHHIRRIHPRAALIALAWLLPVLVLVAVLLFAGCASGKFTESGRPWAHAGIAFATGKVIENNPRHAARIEQIAREIRETAGAEGFATVPALMAAVRGKIRMDSLSPADRDLAELLMEALTAELTSRFPGGVIAAEKLITVAEIAGWVEAAAQRYTAEQG